VDVIWRPRSRPLLPAWDLGRDKRDKVRVGVGVFDYVCMYIYNVGVGWGREDGHDGTLLLRCD
jgi:hypothetical protein